MNDIDPAKMNPTERMALFASFTKDVTPAAPRRQTVARQIAPWAAAIRAERAPGLDWKQLAQICATHLKIKVSPSALQKVVRPTGDRKRVRKLAASPSAKAPAVATPSTGTPGA